MKRSRQSRKLDQYFARCEAEDRAAVYLDNFPPQIAHAIALRVEWVLAMRWNEEQSNYFTHDELQQLETAVAAIPPGVGPDAVAEGHVIDLLSDFPPDRAWWIARRIVRSEDVRARLWEMGSSQKQAAKGVQTFGKSSP